MVADDYDPLPLILGVYNSNKDSVTYEPTRNDEENWYEELNHMGTMMS